MKLTATIPAVQSYQDGSDPYNIGLNIYNNGDNTYSIYGFDTHRRNVVKVDKNKLRAALDALDLVEAKND
jgi:hypothetical protein